MSMLKLLVAGLLGIALGQTEAWGQTPFAGATPSRILQPQSAEGNGSGWMVDPKNGYLQFTLPLGTLGGDIPVPIVYRLNGTHVVREHYEDSLNSAPYGGWTDADEPAGGGLHFGSVGGLEDYSNGMRLPWTSLMEDGTTIRWNSVRGIPGGSFSLPQAFGLGPFPGNGNSIGYWLYYGQVSMPPATISADGRSAWYGTNRVADLGQLAQHIQLPDYPAFVAANAMYHVVLTQDIARIYVETPDGGSVPVLWADRFGHKVKFIWKKTTGPAPFDAVVSVKVLNDQGNGVLVHWPVVSYEAGASLGEFDLLRVDWIGVQAPAIQVRGLPVSPNRPPELHTQSVETGGSSRGELKRPTLVRMGNPAGLSLPSWSLHAPVPTYPTESSWASDLTWRFTYDAASGATVSTYTDPLNTVTTFSYVPLSLGLDTGQVSDTFTYFMGVSQAISVDAQSGVTLTETWDRTLLNHQNHATKWECRYNKRFSGGSATGQPLKIYRFPDLLNGAGNFYNDGVLISEETQDQSGTSFGKTTYGYQKGGLTGLEPLLTSIITVRQGEPTRSWSQTYSSNTWLPLVETTSVGGVKVEEITHGYETRWDLAIPGRETSRTVSLPGTLGGTLTSYQMVTSYDPTTWRPSLSYRLAGGLSLGNAWTYDSGSGRLASSAPYVPAALGATSSQGFSYSPQGWLQNQTTTFTDGSGNATVATAWGPFTTQGQPLQQTDSNGVSTVRLYDSLGRVLSTYRPGSPTLTTTYSADRRRIDFKQSDGPTGREDRDGFGRLASRVRMDGVTESYTFDSTGRVAALREEAGGVARVTTSIYDPLGRLQSQTKPGDLTTSVNHAAVGANHRATATTTNRLGASTTMIQETDPFGRTVLATDPLGNTSTTTYDLLGNPTRVEARDAATGQTQVRTFTYNGNGFLTSRWAPETGTTSFYDHNQKGQPARTVEDLGPDGHRTRTLLYDGLGRLRSSSNGNASLTFTYSAMNLANSSSTGPNGTVTQTYRYGNPGGALDLETTSIDGKVRQVGYVTDPEGHLTEMVYPSGRRIGYTYENGKVKEVKANGAVLATAAYDAWSHLNNLRFASGSLDHWNYDQVGARLGSWMTIPGQGNARQRNYSYDANLNLESISGDWSYLQHDVMGHLLSATGFSHTETFIHDGFANNTSSLSTSGTGILASLNNFTLPNPLTNNRVPAVAVNGALTGWDNPARGEASTLGTAIGSQQNLVMDWDSLGRLNSVRNSLTGSIERYCYSAAGLRVSRTNDQDSTQNRAYAYSSGGQLLGEYSNQEGVTSQVNVRTLRMSSNVSVDPDPVGTIGVNILSPEDQATKPCGTDLNFSASFMDGIGVDPDDPFAAMEFRKQYRFRWNFGDGTYGDGSACTHNYTSAGTYTVTVMALPLLGQSGLENFGCIPVTVNIVCAPPPPPPPTPIFRNRDVVYLGSMAIAEIDANGVHELHCDHLSSPRLFTNGSTGAVEGTRAYAPYGELLESSGYVPLTGFTGHLQQDATGLIYMKGRYYSTAWHRFVNSDQGADPRQSNQNAYCNGNPMQMTDPTGMVARYMRLVGDYQVDAAEDKKAEEELVGKRSLWERFKDFLNGSSAQASDSIGGLPCPDPDKPKANQEQTKAGDLVGWGGIGASTLQYGVPRGLSVGSNLKVYGNFFGNQYVRAVPVGKIAGLAGTGLAVAGVGIEAVQLYNGTLEGGGLRFGFDTTMAGVGIYGGPIGAVAAGTFFIVEPMLINTINNAPRGVGSLSNQNITYTDFYGNVRCF